MLDKGAMPIVQVNGTGGSSGECVKVCRYARITIRLYIDTMFKNCSNSNTYKIFMKANVKPCMI